ncbi:hypothetical protein BHE74_00041256 [Ensete ventricosum]|nr:hypothetical protein BHE74_00041256 [Ensete ventricosum]
MLVLQIVTKHLKQDNGNIQSSSKPQTESLLAQVASVSKTFVVFWYLCHNSCYCFWGCWISMYMVEDFFYIFMKILCTWQGWKVSDMMFVTRRGLSDVCTTVGKQLELISASIAVCHHLTLSSCFL